MDRILIKIGPAMFMFPMLVFLLTACKQENKTPPNIVFIAIDDLRPDLGCYGNTIVKSPNINSLAENGVTFTNHFVQVPTCGASRYSLITGMRPRDTSQLKNSIIEKTFSGKQENQVPESFIHQLKRNGYYTVGIGKITHSPDGMVYGYEEPTSKQKELPHSWNELVFDNGKWGTGWNAFFGYASGENRQSLKKQVKPYEAGKVGDDGYVDGLIAKLAVGKLHELKNREKPFFLGVGFFKPHLPFNSPKKYWDFYDRNDISVAKDSVVPKNVHPASLHNSFEFNQYALTEEVAGLSGSMSTKYSKKLKHAYYAAISYVDVQVGKILNAIKDLELEENTIVVVWGDHGWHLGDKRVWGKHTLFENSLKSALIVKVPGVKTKKAKNHSIVETVDIYPTILELCNIKISHKIDGKSFMDIMERPNIVRRDTAYSYFNRGITMRTEKYRLTKYFRKEEPRIELYDHRVDSAETKNIAMEKPEIVEKFLPMLEKQYNGMYHYVDN